MIKTSPNNLLKPAQSALVFLAEWLLFALLALAATRPLAQSWTTTIPQGTEPAATVPLFNLWSLGWNVSRAEKGIQGYWDAPIFYPAEDAFAFSEPQPLMMLTAPVTWCGGSLPAAYNIYLWLGLSLTGVITCRFARAYTESAFIAWTTGAMMVMLPFVHWQSGVLQLTPLFGVVATIYALAKFGDEPTIGRSLLLGCSFAVTYFLCNYYGLFLSLILVLSGGLLLGRNLWNWRSWLKLLPGAGLCLLLIGPMIYHQKQVLDDPQWDRDLDYIKTQSAEWGDFTAAPWPQVLPIPEFVHEKRPGWTLSPGYLKIGLAILGLAFGLWHRPLRLFTLFLATFTMLGVLLAMGPKFEAFGTVPYESIREYYPGFSKARNAFRFVVFAQIGVVMLAGLGLDGLRRLMIRGRTAQDSQYGLERRLTILLGLGFLAVVEVWPGPQKLYAVPDYEQERGWIGWVQENTDQDAKLACIPFPKGSNATAYFGTTVWMYYALEHERPILNGYSGFFPPEFLELKRAMAGFPNDRSLKLLIENGAEFCIVFRGAVTRKKIESHPIAGKRLQWVYGDDRAEIDIYQVRKSPRDSANMELEG